MAEFKNFNYHNHGPQSVNDGVMTYGDAVKWCKENGADAIALTDHYTLSGSMQFYKACIAAGIKPVLGCEIAVNKEHLLLLALDEIGFRLGVSKIVTASNKNIDAYDIPRANWEILEEVLRKDGPAYGHVLVTTACMQGVANAPILINDKIDKEIAKLKDKQKKYTNPADSAYEDKSIKLSEIKEKVAELTAKKKTADALSKKSTAKLEKSVEAAAGTPEGKNLLKILTETKESIKKAAKEKDELTEEITKLRTKTSELNKQVKEMEKSMDNWIEMEDKIEELEKKRVPASEIKEEVKKVLLRLADIFGKENVRAEVQYHRIPAEAKCMPTLAEVAKECGIPLVAANDAHMAYGTQEERRKRTILRSLRFNKYEPEQIGDSELYLKTDEDLTKILSEILSPEDVKAAIDNKNQLAELCNYEPVKASHYPKYIFLKEGETSDQALSRLCNEKISWRFPNVIDFNEEYKSRLDYEIDIITKMGFSDYHLIVQDFLNFGRKLGHLSYENLKYLTDNIAHMTLQEVIDFVDNNQTEPGYTIGPGRGSAAGSLVCYLLGITDIDPILNGLLFERFLNPERVSMPDIDSDFASEIRDLVIEYVKKLYGENSVCCIMTRGTQAPRSAVRNAARIISDELYGDKAQLLSLSDEIAKKIPEKPGTTFNSVFEINDSRIGRKFDSLDDFNEYKPTSFELEKVGEWKQVKSVNDLPTGVTCMTITDMLKVTFGENKNALKIINDAVIIEGTFTHYGMHAAGVIISDNGDISDYIPLMWDKKKKVWKSQWDKEEDEEAGMLKMDFLGLNNLSIITRTLRYIKARSGISIDMSTIKEDVEVFKAIFCSGKTNNVFQFESGGMKKLLQKYRPLTVLQLTLLNALFRPGPLQYADSICEIHAGKREIKFAAKFLEKILTPTSGYPVYQEQIMEIFRDGAGYSYGESDLVRRYMAKKKADKLEHERESFIYGDPTRNIDGCVKRGIAAEVADDLFNQMLDFASYAFNKSHACAYATVAYMTAWLKYNYPHEYLCACMNHLPMEKIPTVIEDCKDAGVKVLPPNINKSDVNFAIVDDEILFGLGGIKSVGASADAIIEERKKNGRFVSFLDYLTRGHVKKDSTEALIKAGALDMWNDSRSALISIMPVYANYIKTIADKTEVVKEKTKLLEELDEKIANGKIEEKDAKRSRNSLVRSINAANETIVLAKENLAEVRIPYRFENKKQRLNDETEYLGMCVSAHPLDEYVQPKGTTPINDLEDAPFNKVSIYGIIRKLRITQRKKDGANMAFFELEDRTGSIACSCFTKEFAEFGELIAQDEVVEILGTCSEKEAFNGDGMVKEFNVKQIKEIAPHKSAYVINVKNHDELSKMIPSIEHYVVKTGGHQLIVYLENQLEFFKTGYQVTDAFVSNELDLNVRETNFS